jgi:hypothetical protein
MSPKLTYLLTGLAVALFSFQQADASTFDVNFLGGGFTVDAQVIATPDAGNYDITKIVGTVSDTSGTFQIDSLVTGTNTPPNTGSVGLPTGTFSYNDVIFSGPPLQFDGNGLLFTASDGFYYNIFSNTSTNDGLYQVAEVTGSPYTFIEGAGSITAAVPETSTWAMMVLGFAGLGVMAYRNDLRLRVA